MAFVTGGGDVVGIEIGEVENWGDGTGALQGSWYRVPLLSASDTTESETISPPEDLSAEGGNPGIDIGSQKGTGEFECRLDYVAYYMGLLLSNAFGAYNAIGSRDVWYNEMSLAPEAQYTHWWVPQSRMALSAESPGGLGKGLLLRVTKSGDDVGYYTDVYEGMMITGFTINQPDGQSPSITFRWEAKPTNPAAGVALQTVEATRVPVNVNDIQKPRLEVTTLGQANVSFDVQDFSITFERNIEFGAQFLQELGTQSLSQPSYRNLYDVSFEVNFPVKGDVSTADDPYDFLQSGFQDRFIRFTWDSLGSGRTLALGGAGYGYQFDVTIPKYKLMDSNANIEGPDPIIGRAEGRGQSDWMLTIGSRSTESAPSYKKMWAFGTANGDLKTPILIQICNETAPPYQTAGCGYSEPHGTISTQGIRTASTLLSAHHTETRGFWFLQSTGDETSILQLAARDTNVTLADNAVYRLRFLVHCWKTYSGHNFQLQYRHNGGSWTNVTAASTHVQTYADVGLTEDGNTTKIMSVAYAYAASNEGVDDTDGAVSPSDLALTRDDEVEYLFSLENQGATPLDPADTLEFRLMETSTSTPSVHATGYPTVTIS